MNIAGVYFCKEAGNIGDQMCCPLDYVSDFGSKRIDLRAQLEELVGWHLVFGGGGLFHSGSQIKMEWLTRLVKRLNVNQRLIVWGAGLNHHDQTGFVYPDFLLQFDLVGMREWGNPYEYVPCPSCMHPFFGWWGRRGAGTPPPIVPNNEIVVLEHHATAIPLERLPKLNTGKRRDEFAAVLQFLASGQTVITNSYHGAYWALLLGRKVVIWKPFSNRFYGFKPVVGFCDETNWRERVSEAEAAPGYLAECRVINYAFAGRVLACIKGVSERVGEPVSVN